MSNGGPGIRNFFLPLENHIAGRSAVPVASFRAKIKTVGGPPASLRRTSNGLRHATAAPESKNQAPAGIPLDRMSSSDRRL